MTRARHHGWAGFMEVLCGKAVTTGMNFMILLGANIMKFLLAVAQLPMALAKAITNSGVERFVVLARILFLYRILGCVLDIMSVILLTIPIFSPLIIDLDFYRLAQTEQAICFGTLALIALARRRRLALDCVVRGASQHLSSTSEAGIGWGLDQTANSWTVASAMR